MQITFWIADRNINGCCKVIVLKTIKGNSKSGLRKKKYSEIIEKTFIQYIDIMWYI